MRHFFSNRLSRPALLGLAAAGWLFALATPARATVTVEVFFEDGTLIDGSVGILVADVNGDGFLPLTDPATLGTTLTKGQFVGGSDDVILAVMQADDGAHWNGGAGIADTVESLSYQEFGIAPGTPLILYVFPDITTPGSAVTLNDDVVTYRSIAPGGSGGDIGFVAPADPGVYVLSAMTATQGGTFDPANPVTGETSNRAESGVPGSAVGSDDHGNDSGSATPITSGQQVPGYMDNGDADYFSITLTGTSRVTVYTTGSTDTTGSLFGPGDTLINDPGLNDDEGAGTNFRIEEIFVGAGTLHIAVRGKNDTQTGAYQLIVEVIPLKDTECPDATIGKSLFSQRGDGIYNRSGAGQKLRQVSKKRKKLKFFFKVQNDRDLPDTIAVRATRKDRFFKATYFRVSGSRANVTAALIRDNYQATLDGKGEEAFQLLIKPGRKAVRKRKSFLIDAKSIGNVLDRVKADVKAK